ncbi:NAD(P)/FAD-dependent oxidoreductase [Endozoicomonas sp. SCSIO W0465]|uniref:NAD(P)/FAD-dependent oxidoreductase n=1 Tax=Endozoicomonas sp. SCSIO W0465 TaxID=2918516 RepID=UPI00207656B3|nr:NAD(P)/FAD-dependent oxidoreductase [Endozoicomonas sp. SCSIO W0465]USE36231.1 NAD(P)/FAD-dependent oxidoreductase [Endozoicomonas sp. SCSIO W0465]
MPLNNSLLPSMQYDAVIIGAGASGLMCALTAGDRSRKVLVIDHANKIGKKILISGGGRCNYTNMYAEPANYLSGNPHFCKSALARYTQWDFQALVDKHRIPWHEKTLGQLFCNQQSSDIVAMLVEECRKSGVTIRLKTALHHVSPLDDLSGFLLDTTLGAIRCTSLVVATGGLSFPTMGASGLGYELAEQFGHPLIERMPGLVPFTMDKQWLSHFIELSGVSADVIASCNGQSFRENVLFTHRGLSGPAILQISSYWRPGNKVAINWLPGLSIKDWFNELRESKPKAEIRSVLSDQLTKRLTAALCTFGELQALTDSGCKPVNRFSPTELQRLAESLESWEVMPAGTEGYKKAEVTLGGVATNNISSKTFESQNQSGLYFVGEVLDVTGHLGGFNFQWAWASGHCAGLYV